MVTELFAISAGLDRARRRKRRAAALDLLQIIGARDGIRPSDIAEQRSVHRSHVTRQLDELEAAGFVNIVSDPSDARSWIVTLTNAGREETGRLQQVGLDRFALFVADWEAAEVTRLAELLHKLQQSMAATDGHGQEDTNDGGQPRSRRRRAARRTGADGS